MADITCCDAKTVRGTICPLANTCWRKLAPRDPVWQSMFTRAPFDFGRYMCEYYWAYDPKKEQDDNDD